MMTKHSGESAGSGQNPNICWFQDLLSYFTYLFLLRHSQGSRGPVTRQVTIMCDWVWFWGRCFIMCDRDVSNLHTHIFKEYSQKKCVTCMYIYIYTYTHIVDIIKIIFLCVLFLKSFLYILLLYILLFKPHKILRQNLQLRSFSKSGNRGSKRPSPKVAQSSRWLSQDSSSCVLHLHCAHFLAKCCLSVIT